MYYDGENAQIILAFSFYICYVARHETRQWRKLGFSQFSSHLESEEHTLNCEMWKHAWDTELFEDILDE